MTKKKLFIRTYGCQMNVYDSDRMADLLSPLGYETIDTPESADIVLINTCHIREKAAEKLYSELGRLKALKQARQEEGHAMVIAVAGCTSQAEGGEIFRRAPYVDIVLGPQTYHRLPEMIARATRAADQTEGPGKGVLEVDFPTESKFDHIPELSHKGATAFVTIQEGCDKFCRFCIVPYTRGAEYSRPVADITKEVETFVAQGAKEVTLLGQNVTAYHGKDPTSNQEWTMAQLLRHIATIPGLERIRYMTSHPRDIGDDLIAVHGDVEKVMPFLHLPVQSGSDRMLETMNRRHTSDFYRDLIKRLRGARPDLMLSSDFIVGYPGETEADFEETMRLVEDIKYTQAFSFKYSRRPGTPAAELKEQVSEEIMSERLARLQTLLRAQQEASNQSVVKTVQPVLFEKAGRHEGQIIGRTPYWQMVNVFAPERLIGQLVDVTITNATTNTLTGKIVTKEFSGLPEAA